MARNSKAKSKSSKGKTKKNSDPTVQKSKGCEELATSNSQETIGRNTVPLDDEGMETPNQEMIPMYQASRSKPKFTEWLTKIINKHPISRIHMDDEIDKGEKENDKKCQDKTDDIQEYVKMGLHEIQPELDYWASAVYCYIIGANPPVAVMKGFIKRVWGKYEVDKVIGVKKSLYLIRFKSMDYCKVVLNDEKIFFDSKPIMLKAWTHNADVTQEDFMTMPICIHVHSHYKYWGMHVLTKITKPIGRLVKVDHTTANREKLVYARCMIEVKIGQAFPSHVFFIDEHDRKQIVPITYEWRPVECSNCKGIGHDGGQCFKERRVPTHKTWRPKQVKQGDMNAEVNQNAYTEKMVSREGDGQRGSRTHQEVVRTHISNSDENKGDTEVGRSMDLQDKQQDNSHDYGERLGSMVREQEIESGKTCFEECGLSDIAYTGCFYTWSNKQEDEERVYSKLDRVMADDQWVNIFNTAQAIFLPAGISDHSPGFRQKLKAVKQELKELNKRQFSNIHLETEDAHESLLQIQKKLQEDPANRDLCYMEKRATDQYKKKLHCYVQFLQQKARIKWLQEVSKAFLEYYEQLIGTTDEGGRQQVNMDVVEKMYQTMKGEVEKVQWSRNVWERWSIPKHSFSSWLAIQDKLKTKARLVKYGVLQDKTCSLCGVAAETIGHLTHQDLESAFKWINRRMSKHKVKKKVWNAAVNAVVYSIWQ
ncbi:D-ribose pyranase, partial [Bienertia sinuspersici]